MVVKFDSNSFQLFYNKRKNKKGKFHLSVEYKTLLKELHRNPLFKENFSEFDFYEMCKKLLSIEFKSNKEMEEWITSILENPVDFYFYFEIGNVINKTSSNDIKLGNGNLVPFLNLDKDVRSRFTHEYQNFEYNSGAPRNGQKLDHKWFMELNVKSIGFENAKIQAIKDVNRNMNIYKIMGYHDLPSMYDSILTFEYPCFMKWKKCDSFFSRSFDPPWNLYFDQFNYERMGGINSIVSSKNSTDIGSRILAAINILGLIEKRTSVEMIMLFCMISLEKMLLDPDDKETLGWKLAERVSFLIGDNPYWIMNYYKLNYRKINPNGPAMKKRILQSRLDLNRNIKRYYGLRSKIAHSSKGQNDILYEDVFTCFTAIVLVIEKLLQLLKHGITQISYDPTKIHTLNISLLYHIDKLKFKQ